MLQADVRRYQLREAAIALNMHGKPGAQNGILPFRSHPALHGEGVPGMSGLVRSP